MHQGLGCLPNRGTQALNFFLMDYAPAAIDIQAAREKLHGRFQAMLRAIPALIRHCGKGSIMQRRTSNAGLQEFVRNTTQLVPMMFSISQKQRFFLYRHAQFDAASTARNFVPALSPARPAFAVAVLPNKAASLEIVYR